MNRPALVPAILLWTSVSLFGQESILSVQKLEAAEYPPMGVAASIYGDVVLNVTLASDGSASAVTVESGPPMLRQGYDQ